MPTVAIFLRGLTRALAHFNGNKNFIMLSDSRSSGSRRYSVRVELETIELPTTTAGTGRLSVTCINVLGFVKCHFNSGVEKNNNFYGWLYDLSFVYL